MSGSPDCESSESSKHEQNNEFRDEVVDKRRILFVELKLNNGATKLKVRSMSYLREWL